MKEPLAISYKQLKDISDECKTLSFVDRIDIDDVLMKLFENTDIILCTEFRQKLEEMKLCPDIHKAFWKFLKMAISKLEN